MSDGDNSDFLDDPKAYEDEQSDVFSGLSRRGSESYNQPPEELNLRKQDSGAKNPNMVVDLKTRLRKNTSESSEPMMTRHDNPIPPPPMYNPPISHQMPPQQAVEHSGKPVVEIGMRLKSIYPQRYFIFKNMKPQHFKFCKENNYGITQKTNENTLKSAFENSENLLIIFSNTEQRSFLGYARMESDYFDAPEMIDNFTKSSGLTRVDFDNNFIFRIEWKTKNTLRYEFVNHIKNRYNENREVNHSKVFQEVDPAAGKALIALLENPPTEPVAEHEPPEHKRDEQPPMPFHKAPKVEGGNFPPNNFMMNNPMMPPHFGYYPMNPMNPMGGQMPGMGMPPMGAQGGMFPGMPGQPGMMGGMPKQFPYNMNYNDYYMNMQQQQQQQMMKQNKDKGRKKSASSSGSSSRSSSGSSRSSSPKKGSAKGGRRDSKSASRSRSKSHKRQNKMEKRGGGGNNYQKDYQKDYQKGGRKYDNQNPHQNYPHQNKGKFQKFDKFDKFDKNNNYNNKNNYRGGGNHPHNRRRNSRSGSPNNRNNNPKNRFNNKSQRRSNSRSAERRHTPEDQHKEENFEPQQQPERETHQQETQSPIVQRERSLSNHNEEDPFDFGDMEDRISEGGNDRKVEEERQESPHPFDEDIRPGKRRSGSRSNKRSGSASSSKSVTESKSTTTKNQDTDFRTGDSQRKKKFSRDDEPLVITKGNNKIIGGKGGTERLIIGKPNKHNSKQRSPDRAERFERHDRHERYDRHRNDRNDRRRSRDRERNNSSKKSRERDASRDRRDANRDRRETQRERRDDKRDEPKERREEGYESKPKETPRREREPERSMESSEAKGKRIDLRERLTQKDSIAPGSGSITNRIIKKN